MPPQRRRLSLKEKVKLVERRVKCGGSVRDLAKEFKIGKTQVSDILKNKDKWLQAYSENPSDMLIQRNRISGSSYVIDKTVWEWYNRLQSHNTPVSGQMIQEKARDVANRLQLINFRASNGWLNRFKARHKIGFSSIYEEADTESMEGMYDWEANVENLIKNYLPEDVYFTAETGLFYRALPDETLCYSEESCWDGKLAEERLTVVLCANMRGDKRKPLVVGTAGQGTCFKGINVSLLGVEWMETKKAWVSRDVLKEWLQDFDKELKNQNRKCLLFVSNACTHEIMSLDNLNIIFFPFNTTSPSLPVGEGMVYSFKIKYRQLFLRHVIANLQVNMNVFELAKDVNVLSALTWIRTAWTEVAQMKVQKCFGNADFPFPLSSEDVIDQNELDFLLGAYPFKVEGDYMTVDHKLCTNDSAESLSDIFLNEESSGQSAVKTKEDYKDEQTSDHLRLNNYSEALRELSRIRELYAECGDEDGFIMINNLIIHNEHQMVATTNNEHQMVATTIKTQI